METLCFTWKFWSEIDIDRADEYLNPIIHIALRNFFLKYHYHDSFHELIIYFDEDSCH
jgi:hypothetical protein